MAEHSPTPWSCKDGWHGNDAIGCLRDARGRIIAVANADEEITIAPADVTLLLRAVNAVAGPTAGRVDLEEVLIHADAMDDLGNHQAADAVRALVGEFVEVCRCYDDLEAENQEQVRLGRER